jgi:hypothetical protein
MSDYSNPYKSPETQIIPEYPKNAGITDLMLHYLQEASPWLRFMGILGYIGFSIICLAGVITLFMSLDSPASAFVGLLVNGLAAFLAFLPARFLYNFGTYIRNYLYSQDANDLEAALSNNKSYWKFTGILTIIILSLFIILIIVGITSIGRYGDLLKYLNNL